MIDCGACGGKESPRELNLPIAKGLVGDKTVDVLRGTGCDGVVVDDNQLTGKWCLIVKIDNTVLLVEKARHIICPEKWKRYAYRRSNVIVWKTSRVLGTLMTLI